mgnify:CR=1 FL=1
MRLDSIPTGTVVVGLDGSTDSDGALRWAVEEARIHGAALDVVHAWLPHPSGNPYGLAMVDPAPFKKKFGVEGRRVILTFGLLSPGNGRLYALDAAGDSDGDPLLDESKQGAVVSKMHYDKILAAIELAKEEGYADKWTAAASYASRMLPAIFRPDDPLMSARAQAVSSAAGWHRSLESRPVRFAANFRLLSLDMMPLSPSFQIVTNDASPSRIARPATRIGITGASATPPIATSYSRPCGL